MDTLTNAFLQAPYHIIMKINSFDVTQSYEITRVRQDFPFYILSRGDEASNVCFDSIDFFIILKGILDTQGPKEVLKAIKEVSKLDWKDKYPPHFDDVILFWNISVKEYTADLLRSVLINGVDPNKISWNFRLSLTDVIVLTGDKELVNIVLESGGLVDPQRLRDLDVNGAMGLTEENYQFAESFMPVDTKGAIIEDIQ